MNGWRRTRPGGDPETDEDILVRRASHRPLIVAVALLVVVGLFAAVLVVRQARTPTEVAVPPPVTTAPVTPLAPSPVPTPSETVLETATPTPEPTPTQAPTPTAKPTPTSTPKPPPSPEYGQYQTYGAASSGVRGTPEGYTPVFYELVVGRHGERAATSADTINGALGVYDDAKADGALTALGRDFGRDARDLRKAMSKTGYGELSDVGARTWEQIGERTVRDHADLFTKAAATNAPIAFYSSDSDRAKESSAAMRKGIVAAQSGLKLRPLVQDKKLLHFSTDTDAGESAAIDAVARAAATKEAARETLTRLYGAKFAGSVKDPVGAARDVWSVYAIAPNLGMDFARYIEPEAAAQLATDRDARAFYTYGPGLSGTDGFKSAARLRNHAFAVAEDRLFGKSASKAPMVVLRHGHGETIMPLAALMGLNRQLPKGERFSWSSGWEGDVEAKMAANIDWTMYAPRGKKATPGNVLVTMRYNEQPIRWPAKCSTSDADGYLTTFKTLKSCIPKS